MYKTKQITNSVRSALVFSAFTAAAVSAPAVYAVEEGADIDRIEVTGSRIQRTDLEGASPVSVITAEELKLEGNFTVADALRNSTFNTFGSFSERSGSSAQSQATINLRGAGASRTLVLIDGKRFPGSPTLGGASANLNAIPMAAVERIEILTDGASATYGSDAVAGVVNIIMKKDFEGLEFNIGGGWREHDKGNTSNEFSIVSGFQNDKGGVTFAFDHQKRDGIADADREYTAPWMVDSNGDGVIQAYSETDGWSWYGATVFTPDFATASPSPLCDDLTAQYGSDVFQQVAGDDAWGEGSEFCMYAYGNVSYNRASLDRNTVYVDAHYEIADDVEWFGRTMVVQNSSFGRYAPPAAPWENMSADNPHNPHGVDGAYGLFRWVGIGTRDGNVDDYNQDYMTGFRGTLSSFNDAQWEVYYHFNKADNKSIGQYYLSYGGLAYNEQNGIDLGSEEGVANMKATTLTHDSATFQQFNAGIGFDLFELPAGDIAHYFGMEYFEQKYNSQYDAQSEVGLIGGSAGNSAGGDRDVTAVFYEAVIPVIDSLEVNIAARYDHYSDFGGETSPKIAVRWQPLDDLVVRASYSKAFRAPALDQLYAATTFSAEDGVDYAFCEQNGTPRTECQERQYDTYISANKDLGAETSNYYNLGAAYDLTEDFTVKLDYYNLDIDNVITLRSITSVMEGIAEGTLTPTDTFYVDRAATTDGTLGAVTEVGTGYGNGSKMKIEGTDLTLVGNWETQYGEFGLNWQNSFIFTYEVESEAGGDAVNTAGWNGQPDYKSVFTGTYNYEDFGVAYNLNYIDSTYEAQEEGKLDHWLIQNITFSYDMGKFGTALIGVNNLTDEDPVLEQGKYENADLYNNFGREFRASYNIKF